MDRSVTNRARSRFLLVLAVLTIAPFVLSPLLAQSNDPFYERLLSRGRLEYSAGDYTEAVRSLRIAAFGLMNDLEAYEEAQIYRALSEQGRGELDAARGVIRSVFQAEAIRGVYPPPGLDPAVRAEFEAAVARLFPEEIFPPVRLETAEATSPEPAPERNRSLAETLTDIERLTETVDSDSARRAAALDRATSVLESIVAANPFDADAHLLLARIATERNDWDAVRSHCVAANAVATASDDPGTLLVCQVSMGDTENAQATLSELDDGERQRPDVVRAAERLSRDMTGTN